MKIDHSIQYQSIPLVQHGRGSRGSLFLLSLMASKNVLSVHDWALNNCCAEKTEKTAKG